MEPTFIGEVLLVGGLAVAAISLTAAVYAYDVGNINDAIVTTGAYYEGGSIVANVNGAVVTGANGATENVNTVLPFSAPLNVLLWGVGNPEIAVVQTP